MGKLCKTGCGDTVRRQFPLMERLELWASTTRRQQEALRRATTAAEIVAVLWDRMTDEQRAQLEESDQLRYLVNHLTSVAYGIG